MIHPPDPEMEAPDPRRTRGPGEDDSTTGEAAQAQDSGPVADALGYVRSRGWFVFPVGPTGKPYAGTDGYHDATTDEAMVRAMWEHDPRAQVAVACGPSRIVVADLDVGHDDGADGLASWEVLVEEHGEAPREHVARTPRGGEHLFFAAPTGTTLGRTIGIRPGVDRLGDGYVIVPSAASPLRAWTGSDPRDGGELLPLPDWIAALEPLRETSATPTHSAPQSADARRYGEVASALWAIPASVGRDVWIRAIFGVHSALAADPRGAALVEHWSSSTTIPGQYEPGEATRIYERARLAWQGEPGELVDGATLFALAARHGWTALPDCGIDALPTIDATAPVDETAVEPVDETTAPSGDDEPFPAELLEGDDLLSEWCRWIIGTAQRRQPALALANVIAALGAVIGRRVQTESRLRTNIYALAVAPSGHGKDHPQRATRTALALALLERRIGGAWKSGTGARTALARAPSHCAWLDEAGVWLAATRGKQAPHHVAEINRHLLEAFSAASEVMIGDTYADPRQNPRVDIPEPNLCLLGSSTPDVLFGALGGDAIHGGLLGRMLVFWGERARPPRSAPAPGMDELRDRVVARLVELDEATRPASSGETLAPGTDTAMATHCRTVPYSPEARAALDEIETWADDRVDELERAGDRCAPLWIRVAEHVQKLALIHALARDPRAAEITAADVGWAGDLVRWCTGRLHRAAAGRIADTDYEADLLRVMRKIQEAGPAGIRSSDLARKLPRISSRARKEILAHLIEAGSVVQEVTMTSGRPFTTYRVARGAR